MIIVRAPLRITLGGGGTDVASFYKEHGGLCIAAAIDKYVYITVHETFVDYLILKYSELELVSETEEIKHPIIRAVFEDEGVPRDHLEISSMADIPAGTGLGSSSSFTVALIKAVRQQRLKNDWTSPHALAEKACDIEIVRLGEPIGKQDQYMAAYGGVRCLEFERNGTVLVSPLFIPDQMWNELEDNLLLFFTKYSRSTSTILTETNPDIDVSSNLLSVMRSARNTKEALESGDLARFAHEMNSQWWLKRERLIHAGNGDILRWYQRGISSGAMSGKLVGAGGGGFLMFMAHDARRLRAAMAEEGLPEVRFRFDQKGATAIL